MNCTVRILASTELEQYLDRVCQLMNQLSRRGAQPKLIRAAFDDERTICLAAFCEEELVGFLTYCELSYCTDHVYYVNDVVVDERYRRQGVAHQLIEDVIGRAQKAQCTAVDLRSNQPGAIELYQRSGFIGLPTTFFRRPL